MKTKEVKVGGKYKYQGSFVIVLKRLKCGNKSKAQVQITTFLISSGQKVIAKDLKEIKE